MAWDLFEKLQSDFGDVAEAQLSIAVRRAQEDHAHVTEMHTLMLQTMTIQHQEIQELKELVTSLHGKTYSRTKLEPIKDLRLLHARGNERFESDDVDERMKKGLHHNQLARTLRQDLKKGSPEA